MFCDFGSTWFMKLNENEWTERNEYFFNETNTINGFYKLYDESRNISLEIKTDGSVCKIFDKILYNNTSNNVITKMVHPTIFSPNCDIAIVMLYTTNFAHVCCYSEANIIAYCNKHGYTCYIYKDSMTDSHPTWNKPLVLSHNIKNHKYIMWIDSDAIFTNFDKKVEDIIKKQPNKNLLVCNDIGGWEFNAGVQIWKNTQWSTDMLHAWWNMKHVGHIQGGDQVQLIRLMTKVDPFLQEYHIFDQTEFNCHPKVHKSGMFILHMMGMSGDERIERFKYWNSIHGIQKLF
jgi:hypothetical protein